jgi:hypothetical protein
MPSLVLGSALAFFQAFAPKTQLAGRSKAQTHCLALEGSPLDRSNVIVSHLTVSSPA